MGNIWFITLVNYYIGQNRPGADEPTFALIFSLRSFPHILALEEVYLVNYNTPLRFVVEDEFSGGFRNTLLAHRNFIHQRIYISRIIRLNIV